MRVNTRGRETGTQAGAGCDFSPTGSRDIRPMDNVEALAQGTSFVIRLKAVDRMNGLFVRLEEKSLHMRIDNQDARDSRLIVDNCSLTLSG